jgi:hypothetical protein
MVTSGGGFLVMCATATVKHGLETALYLSKQKGTAEAVP